MTTNQIISARILDRMSAGMALPQAFDAVLGAGSYEKLAGEVWESLRRSSDRPQPEGTSSTAPTA